jgi:putative hydrolase of the HAD superfamily
MIFSRHWQPVKAISFDLDDTLYDNHPFIISAEKAMYQHMVDHHPIAAHTDRGFWRQFRSALIKSEPALKSDMILLRQRTLTAGFSALGLTGIALKEAVDDVYECFYFERSNFKIDIHVANTLEQLANRVPLVAITNGNVDLGRVGIQPFFSQCFHASIQQPMKPHRAMFDKAKDYLGLAGKDILHVGDNLEKDIMGGRQAGFKTAWYAINRKMDLNSEPTSILPDVQLANLDELLELV